MKLVNLLLLDDEVLLVKNLSYLLAEFAERSIIAYSAPEALEVMDRIKVHCVISDISLPGMNGLELLRHVRDSGNQVPFIFYTAYRQSKLMEEAARYGAFEFLTKPNFESLKETIQRGIRVGFNRNSKHPPGTDVTEFQKLLQTLDGVLS
ncbi:MAG TPA: response regulator [Bacteriovoracaceae bacterium]|nr:response regulator [Bacteriovoracaceae bacterium]